jgi:chemotaxis protein MotB
MPRKRVQEPENHERWMVSYADFITLLFAFFVVMFASTQSDKLKAKQVSDSVRDALEHGQFSAAISTVLGHGRHENGLTLVTQEHADRSGALPPKPAPQPADLAKSLDRLQRDLAEELKAGKIGLTLEDRGLIISLREAAFFASGNDSVAPASLPILARVAAELQESSNPLRIEGYTDSVPIHNSRFRSNWELSTARSIAMMEVLLQRFQIAPERMAVVGYAENAPADTNETEEGRAHNRRVELVVLSTEGQKAEPVSPVHGK